MVTKLFLAIISLYVVLDMTSLWVMGQDNHGAGPHDLADLIKASNGSLNNSEIILTETHLRIPKLAIELKLNSSILDDPNVIDKAIKELQNGKGGNHVTKKKHRNDNRSCMEAGRDIMNAVLPSVSSCLKEMKLTLRHLIITTSSRKVVPCFAKCIGIKLKVLNLDGTGNVERSREIVEALVPPRFMGHVMTLWKTCEDLFMTMRTVEGDVGCEVYRRPITCTVRTAMGLMRSVIKLCPGVPEFVKEAAIGFLESSPVQTLIDSVYDKTF